MVVEAVSVPSEGLPSPKPTVLVLDHTSRREEAPISCLDLESKGFDLRYLLEQQYGRELTAADYAASLLDRHGPFDSIVTAVPAYCVAGPIANDVAAALSSTFDAEVPLILIDTVPTSAQAIQGESLLADKRLGQLLCLPNDGSVTVGCREGDIAS